MFSTVCPEIGGRRVLFSLLANVLLVKKECCRSQKAEISLCALKVNISSNSSSPVSSTSSTSDFTDWKALLGQMQLEVDVPTSQGKSYSGGKLERSKSLPTWFRFSFLRKDVSDKTFL